ncbi:MAG: T9SS type A sorting domain-containing protein [Flavobacteriales bacterium]|nr:T9SS type A sorting domain-containing protein [Flavobacteriales bacterium]
MKPFISFCSAALIAATAHAQPTFTAASNTPAPGTAYSINYGPYVAPGGAGANQTWNLSGLATDSSITVQRVLPSTTTNGAQFPTATVAEVSAAVTQYFRVAVDGIHFAGSDDGTSVVVHVPMGRYLPFPCTFGTLWSSPQHASFTYEDMTVTRTGTFSGNVDGYGTLIIPGATIPNVLRVRWTHTLQDAMGPMTINHLYDSYAFFKAGQAHPIAELVTATINMGGGPITNQFSRWTSADLSTGIAEQQEGPLTVFPNPAVDEVTLTWSPSLGAASTVSITDMAGRAVNHSYLIADRTGRARIDVSSLLSGMYQVTLTSTNGRRTSALLRVL